MEGVAASGREISEGKAAESKDFAPSSPCKVAVRGKGSPWEPKRGVRRPQQSPPPASKKGLGEFVRPRPPRIGGKVFPNFSISRDGGVANVLQFFSVRQKLFLPKSNFLGHRANVLQVSRPGKRAQTFAKYLLRDQNICSGTKKLPQLQMFCKYFCKSAIFSATRQMFSRCFRDVLGAA